MKYFTPPHCQAGLTAGGGLTHSLHHMPCRAPVCVQCNVGGEDDMGTDNSMTERWLTINLEHPFWSNRSISDNGKRICMHLSRKYEHFVLKLYMFLCDSLHTVSSPNLTTLLPSVILSTTRLDSTVKQNHI